MIVVTMMGTLLAYGMPKMMRMRNRNNLRAARDEIGAMLSTARAAAIQKGRTSRFVIESDSVRVIVDTSSDASAQKLVVVAFRQMKREYRVSLAHTANGTSSWSTAKKEIPFDSRGFATTPGANGEMIRITGFSLRDSVCITRYGLVAKQGCVQ